MATLPTFTDLDDEQVAHILDAFRPYPDATDEECEVEFLKWIRARLLPEVQRRLYLRLHSGMEEKEREIVVKTNTALPSLEPENEPEPEGESHDGTV